MDEDTKMVKLVSRDGDAFEVPLEVAKMSKLIEETLGDGDEDDLEEDIEVPLPNVSTPVLEKVIDYCRHHLQDPMTPIQTPLKSSKMDDLVQQWYADFCKVPRALLFDMVAAANFMDIKSLLDLTCLAVSILIKGKSAAELREMFNIAGDFAEGETAAADPALA